MYLLCLIGDLLLFLYKELYLLHITSKSINYFQKIIFVLFFSDEEEEDDVVTPKPPTEPEEEKTLKKDEENDSKGILKNSTFKNFVDSY